MLKLKIIGGLTCVAGAWLVCGGAVSQGYWVPPAISDSTAAIEETGAPLIPELTVGRLKIVLEDTSLSEVQMQLGGTLGHLGEAGGSVRWLCYYNGASSAPWVLWIEGISDLHQGTVSAFQWRRVPRDAKFDNRCNALTGGIAFPNGLNLGDTTSKIRAVLGAPSSATENSLIYDRGRSFQIHGNQCGTSSGIAIDIRDVRVQAITAWQATAC